MAGRLCTDMCSSKIVPSGSILAGKLVQLRICMAELVFETERTVALIENSDFNGISWDCVHECVFLWARGACV